MYAASPLYEFRAKPRDLKVYANELESHLRTELSTLQSQKRVSAAFFMLKNDERKETEAMDEGLYNFPLIYLLKTIPRIV